MFADNTVPVPLEHLVHIQHLIEPIHNAHVLSTTLFSACIISRYPQVAMVVDQLMRSNCYACTTRKGQYHDWYFTVVHYPKTSYA